MAHKASGRYRANATLASVLAIALSAVAMLPGCTDPETRADIDQQTQNARSGLNEATHPPIPGKLYNPLVVSDKIWTGNTALRMHRGLPLPAKYETAHGVTVVSSEPMSLTDIINDIGQQTGIPFHVSDTGVRSATKTPAVATPPAFGVSASSPSSAASSGGGDTMPIAYEGPLSGLLERVAGHFGINWRYDGSTISVTRYETRVFIIEALPGSQTVSDGMQDLSAASSSSSSSSSSSGASTTAPTDSLTQSSKFSIDIKYWEELEKVVTSMLGGTGSVVVSPSLGTITVTTTPEVMRMVADYLTQENQRMSRQIAVNVEVYTVTLSKGLNFNIAFSTMLKRLADIEGNIAGAPAQAATSLASPISSGGGALSLAILNPTNGFQSEVTDVFTALTGIGDTTKVAKFPLITLNNRPVSRRIGENVNYVASSTTSTIGTGVSTVPATTLTPGTINQGFSVQLTPRLLDDGRILLQYSLSIQDIIGIDSFNSVCGASSGTSNSACAQSSGAAGSATIQLPTLAVRDFVQQSVLKSGSTLILGGAEEDDAQQNSQGVTDPDNYLLGGGLSSTKAHTMVFFALTPQVLDVPHTERD